MTDADERRPGLAVFVSGSGRSLANLFARERAGRLQARIAAVIADRPGIRALDIAREHGVEPLVVDWKSCGGEQGFADRALAHAQERGAELLVLAGFLRKLRLSARWRGKALNIHPSLLPAFGGKGYYGDRVHAAVLAAGVSESGCTVHYVDDEYDRGAILLQRRVPVRAGDDVHALAARVFEAELDALPEAIERHFAAATA
ncbi:MAG: phosphoribosylglycinamide formyltransferase [Planctomycetes bacterium]|nr:phosphoribosylglycinamide formyltransferase [Planctomycetota bacterium]